MTAADLAEIEQRAAAAPDVPALLEAVRQRDAEISRLQARVAWFDQENMRLIRIMGWQPEQWPTRKDDMTFPGH